MKYNKSINIKYFMLLNYIEIYFDFKLNFLYK